MAVRFLRVRVILCFLCRLYLDHMKGICMNSLLHQYMFSSFPSIPAEYRRNKIDRRKFSSDGT